MNHLDARDAATRMAAAGQLKRRAVAGVLTSEGSRERLVKS